MYPVSRVDRFVTGRASLNSSPLRHFLGFWKTSFFSYKNITFCFIVSPTEATQTLSKNHTFPVKGIRPRPRKLRAQTLLLLLNYITYNILDITLMYHYPPSKIIFRICKSTVWIWNWKGRLHWTPRFPAVTYCPPMIFATDSKSQLIFDSESSDESFRVLTPRSQFGPLPSEGKQGLELNAGLRPNPRPATQPKQFSSHQLMTIVV